MAGTIPQEIQRIENEVATQAAKIAELSTILDGKAAGGGGAVEMITLELYFTNYITYPTHYFVVPDNPVVDTLPELLQELIVDADGTAILQVPKGKLVAFGVPMSDTAFISANANTRLPFISYIDNGNASQTPGYLVFQGNGFTIAAYESCQIEICA